MKGPDRIQDGPKGAQEGSRNYLGSLGRFPSALSGPILGPPWPFFGDPRRHLEANVGLGRLEFGAQGGKMVEISKALRT